MYLAVVFAFALLPTSTFALINVEIKATALYANTSVTGYDRDVISNQEVLTFKITDERLKRGIGDLYGRLPMDVFVKSPTPWGDLYKKYDWPEVHRTLFSQSIRVINIVSRPVTLTTKSYTNKGPDIIDWNPGLEKTVQHKRYSTWTIGGRKLDVNRNISYSLFINGRHRLSYASRWGVATTHTQYATFGSKNIQEMRLEPGQSVEVFLFAKRVDIEVEIKYFAELDGAVATNFGVRHEGHHFWAFFVTPIMEHLNSPKRVVSAEQWRLNYYEDARILVTDVDTNFNLINTPAPVFVDSWEVSNRIHVIEPANAYSPRVISQPAKDMLKRTFQAAVHPPSYENN